MSFDLTKFETAKTAEEGSILHVLHPVTKEPLGVEIVLAGRDSTIYRQTEANMARKLQAKRRQVADPEELEDAAVEIMVACTISWKGVVVAGEDWSCSKEKAAELYRRWPWIKEQASVFIADRANYLRD